jgi:hypothetical protein
MKTITSILFLMMIALSQNAKAVLPYFSIETNYIEPASPCTITVTVTVTGKIGKNHDCKGFGLGCLNLDIDIDKSRTVTGLFNQPAGQCGLIFEYSTPSSLTISYLADKVNNSDFEVEADKVLPAYICKKLGVQTMTILKGIYKSSVDSKGVWKTTFNVK